MKLKDFAVLKSENAKALQYNAKIFKTVYTNPNIYT